MKIHLRKENPLLLRGGVGRVLSPCFFLAWLPAHSPPQVLVLEGRRRKLESWLIKAN